MIGDLPNQPPKPFCSDQVRLDSSRLKPVEPYPVLIWTGSQAILINTTIHLKTEENRKELTTIVTSSHHVKSPRKRGIQIKLDIGVVQEALARITGIGTEDGIVQTGARVVAVDIEVVVLVLPGLGGLEVEGLGGLAGDEGGGRDGGGEEGERGEELHFRL